MLEYPDKSTQRANGKNIDMASARVRKTVRHGRRMNGEECRDSIYEQRSIPRLDHDIQDEPTRASSWTLGT